MAKFSVEEVSPIERRIQVEVDPAAITQHLETAYRTLSRRVQVPGFRPGHIPRRILEARYKEQVESDVVQTLVAESYTEVVTQSPNLHPVSVPRMTGEPPKLVIGEPFRFQVAVEVKPKLDPKEIEGLELKRKPVVVADEAVDKEVDKLREAMTNMVPVEGRNVAQEGDFAIVDLEGTIEGKPFPGSKGEQVTFEVSPGKLTEGNLHELAGAVVDETREVTHTFPAEYSVPEMAGKQANFKVTLRSLRARKVPAADDAFAKEIGAGETLKELKDRIREQLTERARSAGEQEERDQLIKQLIERNPFEAPGALVDNMVERMIESTMERLQQQGIDPRRMQVDFEKMRESMRGTATQEVKGALLLEAVADQQAIQVDDTDVDQRVQKYADQLKAPVERVRQQLFGEEALRGLKRQIRDEKTLAFLASKAKISESEV